MISRRRYGLGPGAVILILILALFLLIVTATGLGYIRVPPGQVVGIMLSRAPGGAGLTAGLDDAHRRVVLEVRLPRILTAAAVGAGLALAGVIFQGLLLNPLADPYTLGVSAGAAFGAALSLLLALDFLGPYTVSLLAFLGALAALAAVLALASRDGRISPTSLILSGVIVAAILSAGLSFIKYAAGEHVSTIIFWLMGSLVARNWLHAGLTTAATLSGFILAAFYARDLNIIALGQRTSDSLGVDTRKVRLTLLAAASFVASVCVSVSGIIGFVGLIVPHLMRLLVGPDNRVLLPASAAAGGLLLLAADTVTRTALPHEVPIGVLTALIGGPYFCYLFRREHMAGAHD
ncbi:MAG: iron ABC transporter permease [Thermodesulfobacteriota bacterium]